MIDLGKKNDWSSVYQQPTPAEYLLFSRDNAYQVPDFACKHLHAILAEQSLRLQRPVNILDLGASYGIMSSLLLLEDMTLDRLTDFFVKNGKIRARTQAEIKQFFDQNKCPQTPLKFYLTDISQPAMKFAERMQLCEQAFCFDASQGVLTPELRTIIPQIDLYLAVGALAYIGDAFFAAILPVIQQSQRLPLFAFTVYRTFYPDTLEQLFKRYGYQLRRVGGPLKQARRFANAQEQAWAIDQLHQRQIDTVGFEDDGYYACEFLLAAPA
jgi:hypothetical protein